VIRSISVCRHACGIAIVVSIALGGCAPLVEMDQPSPQGPRISHLRFVPSETRTGCPVSMKVHYDTSTEEIVGAKFAWVLRHGRSAAYGNSTLPVDLETIRSERAGELAAQFTPVDAGNYYGYVQVLDRSGRLSNVLRGTLPVERSWTDPAPPCPAETP